MVTAAKKQLSALEKCDKFQKGIIECLTSTAAFTHLKHGYLKSVPEDLYAVLYRELVKITTKNCSSHTYISVLNGSFFNPDCADTLQLPHGVSSSNQLHMDWLFIQEGNAIASFVELLLVYVAMWQRHLKETSPYSLAVNYFFGLCRDQMRDNLSTNMLSLEHFSPPQQSPLARPTVIPAEESKGPTVPLRAKPASNNANRLAMMQKLLAKQALVPSSK